jgi:uncharacterized membrane protein HdeD (DUF308 family)
MNTLGWVGSILLSICGVFEAVQSYRTKTSKLTWGFLITWFLGELLVLIPVVFQIQEGYLITNYLLNLVFISIIIYYKRKGDIDNV